MSIRVKQVVDRLLGYFLIGLLLPPTRALGILLHRDHSCRQDPERILFIKLLGLGSLVAASDSIQAIRARHPKAKLILLTDRNIGAGIAPFQLFDEIYPADAGFLLKTWAWKGLWVVDLEVYSKLTTVYALLTTARNRFGFSLTFRKFLNTHNIPFNTNAYLEENYQTMARAVTGRRHLPAQPTPNRKAEAEKPYIALNNTCSGLALTRQMPDETFADVCRWVLQRTPYHIALLGAPSDSPGIDGFVAEKLVGYEDRVVNVADLAGGFEAYYHFLRESCVCLVTIDSGPLHIARKLGLPTVSVWGPTDHKNYLKAHDRHLTCYLGVSCSPCVHRHPVPPCGGNNVCMKEMPAKTIIAKVEALLRSLSVPQAV